MIVGGVKALLSHGEGAVVRSGCVLYVGSHGGATSCCDEGDDAVEGIDGGEGGEGVST